MTVELSVAKRTLEHELAALQKMGVLVRESNTSAGHWVIFRNVAKIGISLAFNFMRKKARFVIIPSNGSTHKYKLLSSRNTWKIYLQ